MKRRLTALLLSLAAFPSLAAEKPSAVSATASARASVTIVNLAVVSVEEPPAEVRVSDRDVRRGWVDVPSAVAMSAGDWSHGYQIEVVSSNPEFESVSVTAPDGAGDRGDLRLSLAPGTKAGTYPLNFEMRMSIN